MKTYWAIEQGDENVTAYYIDSDGDMHDHDHDADEDDIILIAKIYVHGFYVGSLDNMRRAALDKYRALIAETA